VPVEARPVRNPMTQSHSMETTQALPGTGVARPGVRERTREAQLSHRMDIDGLRAVAILTVVAFHCGIPWVPGGFVGVDVFFVISGFLIGGLLHKEAAAGQFSYVNFYARRIRRIAPALLAMLTITALMALALLSPRELTDFSTYALGTLFSVPNIVFLKSTNYFSGSAELNPLLMAWSLGVEEQFYVFFPPLLLLLMRATRYRLAVIAVACIGSFALNVWTTQAHPAVGFYALPPRAWELGVGVLLAIWQATRPARHARVGTFAATASQLLALAGLLMIVGSALLFDAQTAFPGYAVLVPVIGTLLVIGNGGPVNRLALTARPLVFVGLLSYSWYLWHWPLLSFARIACDLPLTWVQASGVGVLALALAWLSYRFVETPFRRGWRGTKPTTVIGLYLAAIAIAVGGGALVLALAGGGLPGRVSDDVNRVEGEVAASHLNPCLLAYGDSTLNASPACAGTGASGSTKPKRTLALLGDSHASALRPGMDDYARRIGLGGVVQLTKSSCPTLMGLTRAMNNHPRHARECARFTQAAFDRVLNSDDIQVVVLAGFWSAPFVDAAPGQGYRATGDAQAVSTAVLARNAELEILAASLRDSIATLVQRGKQVIVVEDTPLFPVDPARKMVSERMPLRRALARDLFDGAAPAGDTMRLAAHLDEDVRATVVASFTAAHAASPSAVRFFSVRDQLCTRVGGVADEASKGSSAQDDCRFAADDLPLLTDSQHLSNHGAVYIAARIP